ncbi:LAMI_0C01684g1_1 [Lachancea mirantina]|uniref:LAMI_0C01684g1_1 n=1 Tax=Lachancea mirantina TaxID=1230905 RepID=A0A1G4J0Z5_9SACH|nr:LAMI_0C01684g1_1 [Lachancea mirantina]
MGDLVQKERRNSVSFATNKPVDAHLVVHYVAQDHSHNLCVTRTSICIERTESLAPSGFPSPRAAPQAAARPASSCLDSKERAAGAEDGTLYGRRLSASMRVCDLYQCVHAHGANRRPSEIMETSQRSKKSSIVRAASYAADNTQKVRYLPRLLEPQARSQPLQQRDDCSGSQTSSGGPEDSVSSASEDSECSAPDHSCSVTRHHRDSWVDLSTPCDRHHHRRNSIAIKFRKAQYQDS